MISLPFGLLTVVCGVSNQLFIQTHIMNDEGFSLRWFIEQEHLLSLIEETEKEFKASNTVRAWKVVNTITNRKTKEIESEPNGH